MKLRTWHLIVIFCAVFIILRYHLIVRTYQILFDWITGSAEKFAMTAETADFSVSAVLIIILPVTVALLRNRIKFLGYRAFVSLSLLILLILAAVFAPIVSDYNPEFQKNLSVTRLLPPFTKKYFIRPAEDKTSFNEFYTTGLQIADSISDDGRYYYQGENKVQVNYPADKIETGLRFYLLGTDELGRDIYSRIIYGTRISLTVGIFSVLLSLLIGLIIGFLAGYYEGWAGSLLNRVSDIFLSFPSLFLVILILALFGNSIISVIIVLGFTGWMPLFKIIRGEVKSLKSRDFFITASLLGLSEKDLLFKEMLPVVIAPVVSSLLLLFGNVIVAEASLSYLGLGTGIMYPSWGSMIEQGQSYMRSAWWMILSPGLFLFAVILSANNIGKRIEAYFNPRIK